ncbi:transcription factor bHLH19-like isoform X2 [Prosopis cineraria]|nr:transcription factor bHLH19-like isoform X2 [Prosopis cineraria]
MDDSEDFHDQVCHMMMSFDEEDEEFLRNIMHQQQQQQPAGNNNNNDENKNQYLCSYLSEEKSFATVDLSTDSSGNRRGGRSNDKKHVDGSAKSYILSFDQSNVMPAEAISSKQEESSTSELCSLKRIRATTSCNVEPRKKTRSCSETANHIMAERRRRQQLTERFIALSATIPGLKKMDKATILQEATRYVKQLQERVTELEKQNSIINTSESSMISIKKCELHRINDDLCEANEVLPQIDAKVLENQVLFGIFCEKQKGIEFKILTLLENFHLHVTSSSVLPFGNSTLGITIIAQMGEEYRMTVNEVMKKLRQVLSKSHEVDPY